MEKMSLYEFSHFRLDPAQRILLRQGARVHLHPKTFLILQILVEANGEVVSKEELMTRVWPDVVVEENNLTKNISLLRKALGNGAELAEFIETIPKIGYRFRAEALTIRSQNGFVEDAVVARVQGTAGHPQTPNDVASDEQAAVIAQEQNVAAPRARPSGSRKWPVIALLSLLVFGSGFFFYARRGASSTMKTKPAAEERTNNPEARRLYLKGRYEFSRRSHEALLKGRDSFEQAIKLDPNYAAAWVGLANCWTMMGQINVMPQADAVTHARAAITRALELDDSLVEAHATLALIKTNHDWDWEGAEREYRRALALDANYAQGWHWFAMHLSAMERHDEALSAIRRAEELDPVSLIINTNHGWILWCARRHDEAIAQLRKTIDLNPHFANAHAKLGNVHETREEYAEAVEEHAKDYDLSGAAPEIVAGMRAAYRQGGWSAFARHEVNRLQQESQTRYANPKELALAWARVGDKDRAMEWLERGYAERSEAMLYLKVDPRYDGLRNDPRFVALLRRPRLAP